MTARSLASYAAGSAASSAAAFAAALILAACASPPPGSGAVLEAAIRSQPIVLFGEVHDNAAQHALRAEVVRGFVVDGARPAIAMEQFDRERQADLDLAMVRPDATAASVIAAAAPADAGWDWALYEPVIALAIRYHLPLLAANVSRADTRRVVQGGLAEVGFDPRVPADIDTRQAQAIVGSHCGMIDVAQAGRMVGAQVARDQFMARLVEANAARGVLLFAGNGHVRRDVGVPRWLSASARSKSVSIGLLETGLDNGDTHGADHTQAGAFDVVVTTAAQPRPDPCAAFTKKPAP